MELSPGQAAGASAVKSWLASRDFKNKPFFYVGGYAGTGKTTIAKVLTEEEKSPVFAAYTGKAASVLQRKGIPAQTIHSLIYTPIPLDEKAYANLSKQLNTCQNDDERKRIQGEIKELCKPRFELNSDSDIRKASLITIDEVSMVGEEMGRDLLSFGVPVLVLGDPGQLPPVTGEGFFTAGKPDVLLTEIHRQAAGNPIIGMATIVRQGSFLKRGKYGSSEVVHRTLFNHHTSSSFDQIICGRNATRKSVNSQVRDLLGYLGSVPAEGEKVICLKNDKEVGILNGTQWRVVSSEDNGLYFKLKLQGEEQDKKPIEVDTHPFDVDFNNMPFYERKRFQEFDFGYAITCHKSQGSQWGKVLIHNESWCFRENASKWLYTALTRAEESVMVVL